MVASAAGNEVLRILDYTDLVLPLLVDMAEVFLLLLKITVRETKVFPGSIKLHETSVFLDICSNHCGVILDNMHLSGAISGDAFSCRFCYEEGKGFRTAGRFVYFND